MVYLLVYLLPLTKHALLLANLLGLLLKTWHLCRHPYELLANCLHAFRLVASLLKVFRFSFIFSLFFLS